MKSLFNRLSIRYKLVALMGLGSGMALLISAVFMFYAVWVAERDASIRNLHQMAGIMAENMRAALAFNDSDSAARMLTALEIHPYILQALVISEDGSLLGQYRADELDEPQSRQLLDELQQHRQAATPASWAAGSAEHVMRRDYHYVIAPVLLDQEYLGVFAIVVSNRFIQEKLRQFALLLLTCSLLLLALLLFLSLRLQWIFSRPVLDLLRVMRGVGSNKQYDVVLDNPYQDEFGELYQGFNGMLREIQGRDQLLSKLATTDELTGLANRRHALENLAAMLLRGGRKDETVGIILLDIDHFKQVNDTWGHATGDLVLKQVARILRDCARSYDMPARFGGEEFLVLCDNADLLVAQAMAERIRTTVADSEFLLNDGRVIKVTVSLGVCVARDDVGARKPLMTRMIEAADKALYRAKDAGRNRVETGQL